MPVYARDIFTPFLTYITLIFVFCLTDDAARILPWILSFYLPSDKMNTEGMTTGIVRERESARVAGKPERIGALEMFGLIQFWTQAACMAGNCFIHCAMPLDNWISKKS